ncbi:MULTISPECIES: hypothetical protein [Pseudoalteromonas]|uniref:hypothetical protein n=1 Tax=Pseudoalteromonas TaxID=53246 RepID=UPI0015824391|nr:MULTISPECIES: hypothetical protein [Pseudoalteromonas]MDI4651638.1 hypothetical protein [Pseudoalteromonas shioyasakiensis]NUJ37967.1 hypothetical protein [Pseudoalteromonas sp. 0303]
MRELNVNEIQVINGGHPAIKSFLIGYAASKLIDYALSSYVNHMTQAVAGGWGSNPGMPTGNSAGFGTL